MSMFPAIALVPYLGTADDGLNPWRHLQPSERRRLAMQAAREQDAAALCGLTEAWLCADPRPRTERWDVALWTATGVLRQVKDRTTYRPALPTAYRMAGPLGVR